MQNNFVRQSLISLAAVALAMGWAVVPESHSQPQECSVENVQAPVRSTQMSSEEQQDPPGADLKKKISNTAVDQLEHREDALNSTVDHPVGSSPVKNKDKTSQKSNQLAMRKPHEMDDHEMDGTCGGLTGSFDMNGNGDLTLTDNSTQNILLSGQAQQNLNSLVNIISVNSTISVLMNLNVNINSTVGTVNQGNMGTQNTGVQNSVTVGGTP